MPQTHLSQGIYIPKKFLHRSEGELYRDICCSVYGRSMLGDGYIKCSECEMLCRQKQDIYSNMGTSQKINAEEKKVYNYVFHKSICIFYNLYQTHQSEERNMGFGLRLKKLRQTSNKHYINDLDIKQRIERYD